MKSFVKMGITALPILLGAMMMASAAQAATLADLVGTWSGSLTASSGAQVPMLIHVMADGTGTADSPAQGVFGAPVTDIALEHNLFSFNLPSINVHYHGMLDGDIMAIDGQWEKGDAAWPLRLVRRDAVLQP